MQNRYIYHYFASYQINGKENKIDGIADMGFKILDMSGYHLLKSEILEITDAPIKYPGLIRIESLTLLKVNRLWWKNVEEY